MPNEAKKQIVKELEDKLSQAEAVYLTDYRGMTMSQLEELRSKLAEIESRSQYTVVKNTLFSIALKNTGYRLEQDKLSGPTAALVCFDDQVAPLAAFNTYAKNAEAIEYTGGFLHKEWLDAASVTKLAGLPPIDTLRAQAVGMLAQPLIKLQMTLNRNLHGLVRALEEVRKSKQAHI